jgi:hypothetical protein
VPRHWLQRDANPVTMCVAVTRSRQKCGCGERQTSTSSDEALLHSEHPACGWFAEYYRKPWACYYSLLALPFISFLAPPIERQFRERAMQALSDYCTVHERVSHDLVKCPFLSGFSAAQTRLRTWFGPRGERRDRQSSGRLCGAPRRRGIPSGKVRCRLASCGCSDQNR